MKAFFLFIFSLLLVFLQADLIISEYGSNRIFRFNESAGEFSNFITQGSGTMSGPGTPVYGADGNLYVVSWSNGKILKYDGQTGAFLSTVVTQSANTIWSMALGADNQFYGGIWSTSGSVYRYNSSGIYVDTFISASSGGLSYPSGLQFGPDGKLYVASYGNNTILRYNGTTGQYIDTFVSPGVSFKEFDLGLDGNIYVGLSNGSVNKYNGTTGAFTSTFAQGMGTIYDVEFSHDGNILYVNDTNYLYKYNAQTGQLLNTYAFPTGTLSPWYMTFMPSTVIVPEISSLVMLSSLLVCLFLRKKIYH